MSGDDTIEQLADEIVDDVSPGLQLWAAAPDGTRLEWQFGTAGPGPMMPWSMFPMWCASKPVLFQAALSVAEQRGVTVDEPIAPLLPAALVPLVGSLTLRRIGSHEPDLSRPGQADVLCAAPAQRQPMLLEALGAEPPTGPGYSEFAAWAVAEAIVEVHHDAPAGEVLDRLLEDAGLYELSFSRIPVDDVGWWWGRGVGGRWVPMVGHAIESELAQLTPALSGVGSARGLGEWYCRYRAIVAGTADGPTGVAGLFPGTGYTSTLAGGSGERWDATHSRVCGFRAGYAEPLSGHGVPSLGEGLGHLGWLGRVFGLHDPASGIVVCGIFTGAEFEHPEAIEPIRDRLVAAAAAAVTGSAGVGAHG